MSQPNTKSHRNDGAATRMTLQLSVPNTSSLDYTIRIGSTPNFLYFDSYLYFAYAAHYFYCTNN